MRAEERFTSTFRATIATATEAALTALQSGAVPFDRYLQALGGGSADAQYIKLDVPSVMNGKTLTVAPVELPTVGFRLTELPYQLLIPANETPAVYGYQDSGGNQAVTGILEWTDKPVPGKPVGMLFSERTAATAGNGSMADGATAVTLPTIPGKRFRLLGLQGIGAGAQVDMVGIKSASIPQGQKAGERGPHAPGQADVSVGLDIVPITDDVVLNPGDSVTVMAQDASAGTVQVISLWGY